MIRYLCVKVASHLCRWVICWFFELMYLPCNRGSVLAVQFKRYVPFHMKVFFYTAVNQDSGQSPYTDELVKSAERLVLVEQKKYLNNFFDKARRSAFIIHLHLFVYG